MNDEAFIAQGKDNGQNSGAHIYPISFHEVGALLRTVEEEMHRWREHFERVRRKPTETSVTEFCFKIVNLSLEEFRQEH